MPKPMIVFDHDARHPSIYMYEPPICKEEIQSLVDELVGTPVQAISLMVGDTRSLMYDTKAGQRWGQNVSEWPHLIWRRAKQNFDELILQGTDCLRIVCDRAHENGIKVYAQILAQQGARERMLRSWENPAHNEFDWKYDVQPLELGAKGGMDQEDSSYRCLDFKNTEIREDLLSVVNEVVANYPIDGVEIRFDYEPYYFRPDDIVIGRRLMTELIGEIHGTMRSSGRRCELMVRTTDRLDISLESGLDPIDWMNRGIIDLLVLEPAASADPNVDFQSITQAADGTGCRVLAGLHSVVDTDRLGEGTKEIIRGLACNYLAQGVDGLYLSHWFGQWPYGKQFYEKLRELVDPEVMAPKDKHYRIPINIGREESGILPIGLEINEPVSVKLRVEDDLQRWDKVGRVHQILLRVRLGETTELDHLSFTLNGKELSPLMQRKINELYRMGTPRFRVNGAYWYVFILERANWPVQGNNIFGVTLLDRDPEVKSQLHLRDLELETKYLLGKNFHRGFIDDSLGYYDGKVDTGR